MESPFQSPRAAPVAPPPNEVVSPLDSFEFNGLIKMDGELRISVFDTNEGKNYWIVDGERHESGLELRHYDADDEIAVIARGTMTKKLTLKKAQIDAIRVVQNNAPAPSPAAAVSSVAGATAETDEQVRRRMQTVAEEIRRRRAERRQRIQQQQQQNRNN